MVCLHLRTALFGVKILIFKNSLCSQEIITSTMTDAPESETETSEVSETSSRRSTSEVIIFKIVCQLIFWQHKTPWKSIFVKLNRQFYFKIIILRFTFIPWKLTFPDVTTATVVSTVVISIKAITFCSVLDRGWRFTRCFRTSGGKGAASTSPCSQTWTATFPACKCLLCSF